MNFCIVNAILFIVLSDCCFHMSDDDGCQWADYYAGVTLHAKGPTTATLRLTCKVPN